MDRKRGTLITIGIVGSLLLAWNLRDPVIHQKPVKQWEEVRQINCTYSGYCFTCLPGYEGTTKCMMKLSHLCPGSQKARVKFTLWEREHESGDMTQATGSVVLERMESCH